MLVATSAGAALFPVFAQLHDSGRWRELSRAFWASFAILAAVCLLAALTLSAGGEYLMRAYGAEFAAAGRVLVIMVFTGAIAAPMTVAGHVISGAGRMWLGFAFTTVWACVLVGLTWVLRARGAVGLAEAYLGAYLVQLLLSVAGAQLCFVRGVAPVVEPEPGP